MNENQPHIGQPGPSRNRTTGISLKARILIGLLVFCLLLIGYYVFYLKEKIIEVSSERLSELLNVDLTFEHYQFIDPRTLEITGLQVQAPYPQSDYDKVNKTQKDWYSFKIKRIVLHEFDYSQFIDNRSFLASHIELDSVEVDVYRDKRLPFPPFDKKLLMASLLHKINFNIHFNTIQLTNTNIRYYEHTKHADLPGMISFRDSKITCQNITNISDSLILNPTMVCNVESTVLDAANLTGQVLFDLNSKSDKFTVLGTTKSFQAEKLNRIISGAMPIAIIKGKIHSMNFRIDGNDDRATGTIAMEYDDMKIEVFDKNDNKFKAMISTFAANTLTRNQNMSSNKDYKQGQIEFERAKDRSMFNYWWKCLRSGIIDIMMTDTGKLLKLDEKAQED